ncbi:MAG: hypothetical protein V1779_13460 [bacterium]
MKRILILVIFLILLTNCIIHAQSDISKDYKKNIIYLDLSTLIIMGSISANYERLFSKNFSIRGGIGYSFLLKEYYTEMGSENRWDTYTTAMILLNAFTSGINKFEGGLGISVINDSYDRYSFAPSGTIGYRYHNIKDGLIFRVGISGVYVYGLGVHLSVGKAF